jgi:hypothetical protein
VLCRLRAKTGGRTAGSGLAGEVELENIASSALAISVRSSPLQHLNLIVKDAEGRVVSVGHYGNLFSPGPEERTFLLQPGEKYLANVSLLGTVPAESRRPGTYTVQAVYEYDSVRAVSPPFVLEWPAGQG